MYKTPKGYNWPCDDRRCMEERDRWEEITEGMRQDSESLCHCANPQICHTVIWTDEYGESCFQCGKWFCESCFQGDNVGMFIGDNDFFCRDCVPNPELFQGKVKFFQDMFNVTPNCAKIVAGKTNALAELPKLKKNPRSELLIWLVQEVERKARQ